MNRKKQEVQLQTTDTQSLRNSLLNEGLVDDTTSAKLKRKSIGSKKPLDQEDNDSSEHNISTSKEKGKHKKAKEKKKFSWSIWKKLFRYSMRRKYHFILGLTLNVLFAMAVSLLPLKVGQVLDQITAATDDESPSNLDTLKSSIIVLGIMTFFLAIATFTRFLSLQFLQEFLAMDMRNDFYQKFIENDLYFFEQYKSGELVSRLSSDVNQAKSAISNNLTFFIRNFVVISASIFVLFAINAKLTLLVLLIVPFYLAITMFYSKRNKVLVREYQDVQAQIAGLVAQKFSGIQVVKAYSTEKMETQRYREAITKGYEINKKKIYLSAMYNSCSQFLPYLGMMLVLFYGGQMVISGSSELTAGQLTSFILYCKSLASSSSGLANSYTNIINGTYAVQKVFQMLDYQPLVDESKGENHKITGQIEFRNVTFKYPLSKTVALRDISFAINEGQYVAFVGQSGSGKSTIIKLIEKFYQIESGSIRYGNHQQKSINAAHLRKQIGLVNQEATLFSGTIRSNIVYGYDNPSEEDIIDAAEKAGCMEFLSNNKRFPDMFQSQVGEKGNQLSGGQRQRVSIARALLRKPKIIIFDEATSALDSNSEHMVQQSIQSLAGNQLVDKPTIIVIAHRLSTIINANRIFVMRNGQIVEVGKHSELIQQQGYYFQLIEKQLSGTPELMSPNPLKSSIGPAKKGYQPPDQF